MPPHQASLSQVLDFQPSSPEQCSLHLPSDIGYGSVSCGGLVASVMEKYALYYASQHPKTQQQTAVRSAHVSFFRPIFPAKGPVTMKLREVSVGKGWSTFRVELFQGDGKKVAASADITTSNFSIPGVTLSTGWRLSPPPHAVNLANLETDSDPEWTCYHTAFHPDGFRRAYSYVKNFIPARWPSSNEVKYVEQWIAPGWDCTPTGSRDPNLPEARWTNDMIQFVVDMNLPIQNNFLSQLSKKGGGPGPGPGQKSDIGSIASTLRYSAAQKKARDEEGKLNWRELADDGSETSPSGAMLVHITMSMFTEIMKKLPVEGVRWLYLRVEAKSIQNGRMDFEVLLFDEAMELVAISNQVAQLVSAVEKSERSVSL